MAPISGMNIWTALARKRENSLIVVLKLMETRM
jgi:hypothetical protein